MRAAYEEKGLNCDAAPEFGRREIDASQVSLAPVDSIIAAKLGELSKLPEMAAVARGLFTRQDFPIINDERVNTVTLGVLEANQINAPFTKPEDRERAIQEVMARAKRYGKPISHEQAAAKARIPGPASIMTIGKWRPGEPEDERDRPYMELESQQLWRLRWRDPAAEREARDKRVAEAKKQDAKEAADAKNSASGTKVKTRPVQG
jgi:hypothetical protein